MRSKILALLGIVAGGVAGWTLVRELGADRRTPGSGRMYVLEREERIAAPLDTVFAFFEDPRNLGELTPPGMSFNITDVENLPMQAGTSIRYTITPNGVPMAWLTEIVEYEPGRGFVDLQVAGPYRYWRHRHTFGADGDSTIMRDRVEYQMPFGPLGRLAQALVVARQLDAIFDYRTEAVRRLFGSREVVEV
jgi:ligand-binding SRPBCC domain-containing protein